MSLRQKAQENDSAGPHIHRTCLVRKIEEGFRRHVPLGAGSIFDLHCLLESTNFLHIRVVFQGLNLWITIIINLNLRQAKVN